MLTNCNSAAGSFGWVVGLGLSSASDVVELSRLSELVLLLLQASVRRHFPGGQGRRALVLPVDSMGILYCFDSVSIGQMLDLGCS